MYNIFHLVIFSNANIKIFPSHLSFSLKRSFFEKSSFIIFILVTSVLHVAP